MAWYGNLCRSFPVTVAHAYDAPIGPSQTNG